MRLETLAVATTIGDIVLKSTILIAIAWGATRLARRSSAAVRHLIWLLALSSILCIPALELVSPRRVIFSLKPAPVVSKPIVEQMPTEPIDMTAAQNDLPMEPVQAPSVEISQSAPPIPAPSASPRTLVTLAGLAWAGGSMFVLLSTVLGWIALRRIKASACEFPPGLRPVSTICKVRLFLSLEKRPPSALTWGALRPTILLPKSAESWPDHRLQTVLMHELEHVRRLDAAKQLVGLAACALYWFNPIVWLAAKAARTEAEAATDDAVLRAGIKPSTYANTLMDLAAEIGIGPRLNTSAGVAFMKHSKIEARVRAILDTRVRRGVSRRETLAATAVAFAALGSLSVVRAVAAPPFADLPAVSSQEVVVQKQTAAEKHAAAEHARHVKAIAAKLEVKRKEYEKAVLRVQHLQANMELLEQQMRKPKTKIAYWKLRGEKMPLQPQLASEQKRLVELQAQLGDAQSAKARAMLAEQTGVAARSQKQSAEISERLAEILKDDYARVGAAPQMIDAASLADLTRMRLKQGEKEQARAHSARDDAVASLNARVAELSKLDAEKKQRLDPRTRAEIAQAVAQLNADKQSTDQQLKEARMKVLEAQADAKKRADFTDLELQDARKAEKDARSQALKAVAAKEKLYQEDYRRALIGKYKILAMRAGKTDNSAELRGLNAKIASGKLKGAELKRAKLELEKMQLLNRLAALERELGNSAKK